MGDVHDLIIVGAGLSGIAAAKPFLQCQPDIKLAILDANSTLGGVWSKQNVYPSLKTNNLRGTIAFADFPMGDEFGVKMNEHIPGLAMHQYLTAYAEKWQMMEHMKFNTKVKIIKQVDDRSEIKWMLTTETVGTTSTSAVSSLYTKNLTIATGITSSPSIPTIPGSQDFAAPIIHSSTFGPMQQKLFQGSKIMKIAVLGGGKSAYDVVHDAASQGIEVEWIIRKSGRGPSWVTPAYTDIGPFKTSRANLATRRLVGLFSPHIYGTPGGFGWLRWLLHKTKAGKAITRKFWDNMHQATLHECKYSQDTTTAGLEPIASPFWYGTYSGILTYEDDFFSYVRSGQVRIHDEDIRSISSGNIINLANGTQLQVQALIAATGFSSRLQIRFEPASIEAELGIPIQRSAMTQTQQKHWGGLTHRAELELAASFPELVAGPSLPPDVSISSNVQEECGFTPWRLYRSMVPPSLKNSQHDNSIVFLGFRSDIPNSIRMELASLWAYAYLKSPSDLHLPDDTLAMQYSAALESRWAQYRSPMGRGGDFVDNKFDANVYLDLLCADLGLQVWRGKRRWWDVFGLWRGMGELFGAYGVEDYDGVVEEWLRKKKLN
jgi:cation diffusion facilitator CzcD-associated flavoprotein CzcO